MSKIVADDLKQISVYKLNEWGLFRPAPGTVMNTGTITWSTTWAGEKRPNGKIDYRIEYVSGEPIKFWLDYKMVSSGEAREYPVNLVSTQCNYGKSRYWFMCSMTKNGAYCGIRCAKLYLYNTYFCCRKCLELTYESNNRSRHYRYLGTVFGSDHERELEEYLDKTNRYYYAGRPTKRAEQLLKLRVQRNDAAEAWLAAGGKL